jgi:hypothetical protein
MVVGLHSSSYAERLVEVGLTSLADRRVRGDAIQVWKYLHGKCPYDHTMLQIASDQHCRLTRHTDKKMNIVRVNVHLDVRRKFFASRCVDIWNRLPNSVHCLDELSDFKCEYDKLVL